ALPICHVHFLVSPIYRSLGIMVGGRVASQCGRALVGKSLDRGTELKGLYNCTVQACVRMSVILNTTNLLSIKPVQMLPFSFLIYSTSLCSPISQQQTTLR